MIIIKSEQYLSELGKGENNQDNGGWDAGNSYVVCDGDGKVLGEVASEIVAQTFLNELTSDPGQDISSILQRSENRISKFIEENPEGSGISSTLALLQFVGNRARIAWVGNSRVYHIRDGKILFRTKDHSWVNDAVSAGIINQEEAVNHPKSKVITRSIQGVNKRTSAEEVICKDVRKNDYFLLISDGISEAWTDASLATLFANTTGAEAALQTLHEECFLHSKDSYTAIIVQVAEVTDEDSYAEETRENSSKHTSKKSKNSSILSFLKRNYLMLGGLAVLIFGILVYIFQRDTNHDTLPEFSTTNAKGKPIDFVEDDIEKIEKKAVEEEEEYTQEIIDDRDDEPASRNARAPIGTANAGDESPGEE
ncbi:MAG: PP2C family protein-serine/threonine phosphatase [Flavobacteriales bacterium]|jgi:serine/threonine protein phosphatase PrpC